MLQNVVQIFREINLNQAHIFQIFSCLDALAKGILLEKGENQPYTHSLHGLSLQGGFGRPLIYKSWILYHQPPSFKLTCSLCGHIEENPHRQMENIRTPSICCHQLPELFIMFLSAVFSCVTNIISQQNL